MKISDSIPFCKFYFLNISKFIFIRPMSQIYKTKSIRQLFSIQLRQLAPTRKHWKDYQKQLTTDMKDLLENYDEFE